MALFQWNDQLYSVKNEKIDSQHKKLVQLLNQLYESMSNGKGNDIISEILNELVDYTIYHFKEEEDLLKKYNYPNLESHINEHNAFTKKVSDFQKDFSNGKVMISVKLMTFLKDWLSNHIKVSDKNYSNFFIKNNII